MENALTATAGALWGLHGQLFDLLEMREEIGARSVTGTDRETALAELHAIDSAIADFVAQKAKDVDEVRGPVLAMRTAAGVCRAEAKKAEGRALAWDRRAEQIEEIVKRAMLALSDSGYWRPKQTRKFVSALGTITLKGNGGSQPVVISDESLIPEKLCMVEVKMSAECWRHLAANNPCLTDGATVRRTPSLSKIREALEGPCMACLGGGEMDVCMSCGGSGRAGVPGAYLDDRGTSVVIR